MEFRVIIERNVPCTMRDGTVLYSDIYRPDAEGRFPVILYRTPYDKDNITHGIGVQVHPVHAARHGYVVALQDVRGRWSSHGRFNPFVQEIKDGYDAVEWAAGLPYSNGKVGMFGGSYTGVTQVLAGVAKPPHLVALSLRQTASNYYQGWTYRDGAFLLGFNISWSISLATGELSRTNLPDEQKRRTLEELAEAVDNLDRTCSHLPIRGIEILQKSNLTPYFYDWLDHPEYDEFWEKIDAERHYEEMNLAALHIGGWYDIFLKGTIQNYLGMSQEAASEGERRHKLIIGPWVHGPNLTNAIGEWDSGFLSQGSAIGIEAMQLRWFDYWLKGVQNGIMEEPAVEIFVMGENRWRKEGEWPLARTRYTNYYTHSGGHANTIHGDGTLSMQPPEEEPADTYVYDPLNPVPTRGGGSIDSLHTAFRDGVFDQRPIEERDDVLVYTSQVLDKNTEVTGPIKVRLWASSSELETDFTAKLVDVHPDGYARNLCDGIIRARYRESCEKPRLLEPAVANEFLIDLVATSNLFRKGHGIRLEVSSSNFPKFDRNLNTGYTCSSDSEARKAAQTVYHNSRYPSHVILPIIPLPEERT